jgi:hypothetical protein
MKTTLLTLALGLAALPLFAGAASAHGCHREPAVDRYGWHRHVGPDCDRVEGRTFRHREYEQRRRYEPRCEIKCKYIGPFKTCDKVCY